MWHTTCGRFQKQHAAHHIMPHIGGGCPGQTETEAHIIEGKELVIQRQRHVIQRWVKSLVILQAFAITSPVCCGIPFQGCKSACLALLCVWSNIQVRMSEPRARIPHSKLLIQQEHVAYHMQFVAHCGGRRLGPYLQQVDKVFVRFLNCAPIVL